MRPQQFRDAGDELAHIEDDLRNGELQMSYHVTVNRLKELLSELEAMSPLPKIGSPESLQDHEGWMKRHEQVRTIVRKAEYAALLTVPAEVAEVLEQIEARKRTLLDLTRASEKNA